MITACNSDYINDFVMKLNSECNDVYTHGV